MAVMAVLLIPTVTGGLALAPAPPPLYKVHGAIEVDTNENTLFLWCGPRLISISGHVLLATRHLTLSHTCMPPGPRRHKELYVLENIPCYFSQHASKWCAVSGLLFSRPRPLTSRALLLPAALACSLACCSCLLAALWQVPCVQQCKLCAHSALRHRRDRAEHLQQHWLRLRVRLRRRGPRHSLALRIDLQSLCPARARMWGREPGRDGAGLVEQEGQDVTDAVGQHAGGCRSASDLQRGGDQGAQHCAGAAGGGTSRQRDCHLAGTPSSSLPKRLLKGEGGAAE